MTDEKKRRRRRGRRGGQRAPGEGDAQQPQGQAQPDEGAAEAANGRAPRRDTRRGRAGAPDGPPSPGNPAIRRAPSAGDRTRDRAGAESRDRTHRSGGERDRGGRPQRDGRDGRDRPRRDSGPRMLEAPPPQDPRSIELGQQFRDAQAAVRDARKALDKRRAEFNDEPDWMIAQLQDAERRFEEASTAWVQHLETTGRKMARR